MLTLACASLLGYPGTRHHKLAAAVEFIHTATLLHDDVVDGSGMRRGKRTANLIWGNPASVLVGDFLFSRAFELMVEDGSLQGAEDPQPRLGGDRRGRGRAADRPAPDRHRRGAISRASSAPRPRPCSPPPAAIAPVVAEARRGGRAGARKLRPQPRHRLPAGRRRRSIMRRTRTTMGKGVGDDFRDGKVTLPVILAYARGSDDERAFWRAAIGRRARLRRGPRARRSRLLRVERRARRHDRARAPVRPARDRRARPVSRRQGQGGAGRSGRVRRRPRLLRAAIRRPPSAPSDARRACQPTSRKARTCRAWRLTDGRPGSPSIRRP